MRIIYLLLVSHLCFSTLQAQQDSDGDGMHDNWELTHGLDPGDKTDAFCDYDGDKVINLFEFQMETDPYLIGSPMIVEVTPTTDAAEVLSLLIGSADDPVVIRMSAGEYSSEGWKFEFGRIEQNADSISNRFRFHFQGGWNEDFSEQDPFRYETLIRREGDDEHFFDFSDELGYLVVAREAYIFEGLVIDNLAIRIERRKPHQHYLSVYNCSLKATQDAERFGSIRFRGSYYSEMDARIMNTTIMDALRPITLSNRNKSMRGQLSNLTITNLFRNNPTNTTIAVLLDSVDDYDVDLVIENSIIWAQDGYSIGEGSGSNSEFNLKATNSILSTMDIEEETPFGIWNLDTTMVYRDKEPIYASTDRPHYTIADRNRYKGAATPNGLPYTGLGPDLGVNQFAYSSSLVDSMTLYAPTCGNADGGFDLLLLDAHKEFEFSMDNITFQASSSFDNLGEGEYVVYIRTTDNCGHFQHSVYLECDESSDTYNIDESGLILYPNPVIEQVTIKVEQSKNKQVELFDLTGKKLVEAPIDDSGLCNLNLRNQNPGVYFVKLIDSSTNRIISTRKLIKI